MGLRLLFRQRAFIFRKIYLFVLKTLLNLNGNSLEVYTKQLRGLRNRVGQHFLWAARCRQDWSVAGRSISFQYNFQKQLNHPIHFDKTLIFCDFILLCIVQGFPNFFTNGPLYKNLKKPWPL